MKRLFLDTNILCQEGFSSRNMKVLMLLVEADQLKIYVSEISKREFISKYIVENDKALDEYLTKVKKLNRVFSGKSDQSLETLLEREKKSYEETIEDNFNQWVKVLKINILNFIPENIYSVMNDYFSGGGVFSNIKNRNDIPDSMIHTSITMLLQRYEELTVVINDNKFKTKIEKNPKICAVKSLADFFKLPDIKNKIESLESVNKVAVEVKEYFFGIKFRDFLLDYLRNSKESLEFICLEQEQIYNTDKLVFSDYWGVKLESPTIDKIKGIYISEVFMLSKNIYSIDLEFETIASINFAIGWSDFYNKKLNFYRSFDVISGDGEVHEVLERWHVKLYGEIQIECEDNFNLDYIKQSFTVGNLSASKFILKLEIKAAELIDCYR
jgi:hypothetical protein